MHTAGSRMPTVSNIQPPEAAASKPKLLDQVRQAIRARHYGNRTEKTYVEWIKRGRRQ